MKPLNAVAALFVGLAVLGYALDGNKTAYAAESPRLTEAYVHVPMPPGFQVVPTELDGPVFADAQGKTLYKWPVVALRNGYAGDPKGKSVCDDKITTKTIGYASPYPEGLDLPDVEHRKSCAYEWPPVLAADDAKPVGKWTIITRNDGSKQWAYDDHPLYTSRLDHAPGDVMAGPAEQKQGDKPAERYPVGPPPAVPPGFLVHTTVLGRILLTEARMSVYTSENDAPGKSNCHDDCALVWQPLVAPAAARPQGEWSIIDYSPGVRQWAFRKQPLYTYTRDHKTASLEGSEVPGWHNVYTQMSPKPPKLFTVQESINGDVLADDKGHSIYVYTCGDDSLDQLSCDTLESPRQYFMAICGGFDQARCEKTWHYVPAAADAKSDSRVWSIVTIDPTTGRAAKPDQPNKMRVWAFRDRPVYTYAGDQQPGDIEGHSIGEWQGRRNGFRAFWIREDLFGGG
jgi:predicted lipoprotein with Yx(FWY)xxD motif